MALTGAGLYSTNFSRKGRQGSVGFIRRNWGGMVSVTALPDVVLGNVMGGMCIVAQAYQVGGARAARCGRIQNRLERLLSFFLETDAILAHPFIP